LVLAVARSNTKNNKGDNDEEEEVEEKDEVEKRENQEEIIRMCGCWAQFLMRFFGMNYVLFFPN
jgi:hypothetical protein